MTTAESVEAAAVQAVTSARRVTAGLAVGGLVLLSALVQIRLGRAAGAPRIYGDEFIYAELARSFAEDGRFALRDVPGNGYGFLYPVLIAPAFAAFERLPDAYEAVKAINALVMSLAAVPVYLLTRRVAPRWAALAAAALTLLVPSTAYTATVMTENLFYPLFAAFALALALALERPTWTRQVFLLAVAGAAFATRAQGVALVAALVLAVVAWCAFDGSSVGGSLSRRLAAYRVTLVALAVAGVATVVALPLAGHSPSDVLGAYQAAVRGVDPLAVAGWAVAHLAELDLYVGVVPLAVLPLALRDAWLGPAATVRTRALAATTACSGLALLASVAFFAATPHGLGRLHERNLFYVAPLVFVVFAVWIARGRTVHLRTRLTCAGGAVLLLAAIPFGRAEGSAVTDALALVGVLEAFDSAAGRAAAVLVLGAVLALLVLGLPRRLGGHAVIAVGLFLVLTGVVARGVGEKDAVALAEGRRDWVDARVPAGDVTAVYVDASRCLSDEGLYRKWHEHWQTAFFNRRVTGAVAVGAPTPDGLPARRADIRSGVVTVGGTALRAELVAVDARLRPAGRVLASDSSLGVQVVRTNGVVRFSDVDDAAAARERLCAGRQD